MKKFLAVGLVLTMFIGKGQVFASILDKYKLVRHADPVIEKIPETLPEFLSMREQLSHTPEGGAATFVISMIIYTKNEKLGRKCFTIALDKSQLTREIPGYKGYAPDNTFEYFMSLLRKYPWIPYSYVEGTSTKDTYQLPKGKLKFVFSPNKYIQYSTNDVKLFISSSGGVMPRPINVVRNSHGIWKVKGYSSLFVGVKTPKKKDDDDL